MNTEELEDKIWKYAESWISMSDLHDQVGGDKKTCFDRIKIMIPTQLKQREVKNRIEVVRIDMTRRAEFDHALNEQKKWLGLQRKEFLGYTKPMFHYTNTIVHYIPPVTKENIKEFQRNH